MKMYLLRQILFGFILFFSVIAHGETIAGRVVGVSDGDTLTILDASNTQFKIRPVSYTHLDVYKRQKLHTPLDMENQFYSSGVLLLSFFAMD